MQPTPACEPLTALPFKAPPAKLSMIIKSDTGTLQSRKRQKRKEVVLTDFYHSWFQGSCSAFGKTLREAREGLLDTDVVHLIDSDGATNTSWDYSRCGRPVCLCDIY